MRQLDYAGHHTAVISMHDGKYELDILIPQPLAVGYSNILSGKPDKASGPVLWEKTLKRPRVGPN